MEKDFNYIFSAVVIAIVISVFSFPSFFFPKEKLFSDDNPNNFTNFETSESVTAYE